ncbi:MAG: tetratricopeptide repeat protein, partial [Myxococcota bacterium]
PPMALRHSALSDASMPAARNDGPTSSSADVEIPAGFVAASGSIPTVTGSMTSPPTSGTIPPSVGSANSHISVPRPSPDPDALARLGRLLGTFIFLLAATAGWSCGTTKDAAAPRTVTAQLDLGNQQLAQGRWPEAIKAFGTALDEDGENFDALRGTGLAYLKLQRYEEAERFYRLALDANPKSSLSRNELAVVYMEQRRCQEAVPLFEKVLEDIFYPTPEFAEHNLALAYACLGRTDEAISRLDKLVTKRPYFCLGYLTLSQLASKSRRPEATIRACDDFVHHCEQNEKIKQQVLPQQSAMCYLRKGLAYAEMGDVESARTSFERCQSLGGVRNECTKSLELLPQ